MNICMHAWVGDDDCPYCQIEEYEFRLFRVENIFRIILNSFSDDLAVSYGPSKYSIKGLAKDGLAVSTELSEKVLNNG